MNVIIIADSLYHRHTALRHIFINSGGTSVDIIEQYEIKKLLRRKEYEKALVIGNQSSAEMEKLNNLMLRNNDQIAIRRIFFSDTIKLRKMKCNLIINVNNLIVSSDISICELLALSRSWHSGFNQQGISVCFNEHEKILLNCLNYNVSNNIPFYGNKNINTGYLTILRLKRKLNIRSEYSLYLLWILFKQLSPINLD